MIIYRKIMSDLYQHFMDVLVNLPRIYFYIYKQYINIYTKTKV